MLSDEQLAESMKVIRWWLEGRWNTAPRREVEDLQAAYDEQRAEVERLRAQVAAVEDLLGYVETFDKGDHIAYQIRAALDTDGGSDD